MLKLITNCILPSPEPSDPFASSFVTLRTSIPWSVFRNATRPSRTRNESVNMFSTVCEKLSWLMHNSIIIAFFSGHCPSTLNIVSMFRSVSFSIPSSPGTTSSSSSFSSGRTPSPVTTRRALLFACFLFCGGPRLIGPSMWVVAGAGRNQDENRFLASSSHLNPADPRPSSPYRRRSLLV